MYRRSFVNLFLIAPGVLGVKNEAKKDEERLPVNSSFQDSFVRISKKNSFYFELSNGEPYIVSGPCLAGAKDMETMHTYLKKLSSNGGNFARVWVCNSLFEVEEKFGEFSEAKARNIDQ